MNFFQKKEKSLIKSLIYGFIGGVYFSVLFISRTEVTNYRDYQEFNERAPYDHMLAIFKTSVIISIIVFVIALLYLYFDEKND